MSAVADAIAEIDAQLLEIAPIHEGLKDYARLNVHDDTLAAVNLAIVEYETREGLLKQAKIALENLLNDGFPDLEVPPVTPAVMADLEENNATIDAALAIFAVKELATKLGLGGSPPQPKS